MRKSLGVVDILTARDAAVDGLTQRSPAEAVCSSFCVGRQVLGDEFAEAQTFVQLAHQDEAAICRDARFMELDLQQSVAPFLKYLLGDRTCGLRQACTPLSARPSRQKKAALRIGKATTRCSVERTIILALSGPTNSQPKPTSVVTIGFSERTNSGTANGSRFVQPCQKGLERRGRKVTEGGEGDHE